MKIWASGGTKVGLADPTMEASNHVAPWNNVPHYPWSWGILEISWRHHLEVGRPAHDLFHHFVASHSPWLSVQCALPRKIPRGMVTKRLADLAMTLPIKSLSAILLYSMLNAISTTQSWYKGVEGGHLTPLWGLQSLVSSGKHEVTLVETKEKKNRP